MGCRVLARGVSPFKTAHRRYDCMDTDLAATGKKHVGTHGAFLLKVGSECIEHLEEFATGLVRALRCRTSLRVAAYCIGGEEWSVALATVLFHCIKGWKESTLIQRSHITCAAPRGAARAMAMAIIARTAFARTSSAAIQALPSR